ncbi:relaxin-3-like [Lethenteron reissneri]|uniref:relaxin-3-like n=1 Tax=Lethenteron reissneri TaxID=7753 RepID=UPI002AB5E88D|nr:relaxin-3-like [Lethenteron reissneri]
MMHRAAHVRPRLALIAPLLFALLASRWGAAGATGGPGAGGGPAALLMGAAPAAFAAGGGSAPRGGVKLCGREFIRAVIFACGGSRWKRGGGGGLGGAGEAAVVDLVSDRDPLFSEPHSWLGSQSLDPWEGAAAGGAESPVGFLGGLLRSLDLAQGSPGALGGVGGGRRKRDLAGGLSSVCCKWGCTRGEINALC